MSKLEVELQTQRNVALETSILLSKLTVEYGLEFTAAIKAVEQALARSYWGELPDGYVGSIVPIPGQPGYSTVKGR